MAGDEIRFRYAEDSRQNNEGLRRPTNNLSRSIFRILFIGSASRSGMLEGKHAAFSILILFLDIEA